MMIALLAGSPRADAADAVSFEGKMITIVIGNRLLHCGISVVLAAG
jgi:hypothetical protein